MSQASVNDQITYGYEPPRNVQFSIFLDNRVGKLLDLLQIFHGQHADIAGLSVMDATDHAVVRLLTSRADLTRRLLGRRYLPFSEADVLAVELPRGTSLAELCRTLLGAELNIHYAYPLLVQPRGLPVIALYTDDLVLSAQLLRRKHFILLAENDLGENKTFDTERNPDPNDPDDPDGPDSPDNPDMN